MLCVSNAADGWRQGKSFAAPTPAHPAFLPGVWRTATAELPEVLAAFMSYTDSARSVFLE